MIILMSIKSEISFSSEPRGAMGGAGEGLYALFSLDNFVSLMIHFFHYYYLELKHEKNAIEDQ